MQVEKIFSPAAGFSPSVPVMFLVRLHHCMELLTPSSPGGLTTLSLITNSSWLPWERVAMPLISPLMPVPHLTSCSAYKSIRDKHYHRTQVSYIFTNIPKRHIFNYLPEINIFNTLYSPASAATADICCTLFSTTYLLTLWHDMVYMCWQCR